MLNGLQKSLKHDGRFVVFHDNLTGDMPGAELVRKLCSVSTQTLSDGFSTTNGCVITHRSGLCGALTVQT